MPLVHDLHFLLMFRKNILIWLILFSLLAGVAVGLIKGHFISVDFELQGNHLKSAFQHLSPAIQKVSNNLQRASETASRVDAAAPFKVLSELFLRLIKMIIAPLVLTVIVTGIAKMGDLKSVGRMGIKTLVYFIGATLVALFLGLTIVNFFEPGKKIKLDMPVQGSHTGIGQGIQTKSFISHLVPESIFESLSGNEILPIVVFAIFFGMAASSLGEKGKSVLALMEDISHIMFKITGWIMYLAPIGVFGSLTAVVIQQGSGVLASYIYLICCFYGGLVFFSFVVLPLVCRAVGVRFRDLFKHIREGVILAFSTASSEAAMPGTMEALEKFGVRKKTVGFVLPLGYSFNLDGSIMYMTFATLFIAQMYGIEMSFGDQVKMLLVLMLTSKGMAGVPRASLVVIAGTLSMFHIPVEGLLLVVGVDQLLDMGRSATNVVGNAVASVVIDRWEK